MRTRFKRRRARRNLKRYWRRSGLKNFKNRGRMIANRLRRRSRPEAKWITVAGSNVAVDTNTTHTRALSPLLLDQGVGVNQRVGNQAKFLKLQYRILCSCDDAQTVGTGIPPSFNAAYTRVIIWTPRVQLSVANNYMTNVTINTILDMNIATFIKDSIFHLSPAYQSEAVTADISGAPFPNQRMLIGSFPFPRNVKFSQYSDLTDLDDEKDIVYITVVTSISHTAYQFASKLWYTDA